LVFVTRCGQQIADARARGGVAELGEDDGGPFAFASARDQPVDRGARAAGADVDREDVDYGASSAKSASRFSGTTNRPSSARMATAASAQRVKTAIALA